MKRGRSEIITYSSHSLIEVRRKPGKDRSAGLVKIGHHVFECRLGKGGLTVFKREGDGATPLGNFRLLYGWYRADRHAMPSVRLGFRSISNKDGWCDEPNHPMYNQPVRLPFSHSHEKMARDDRLYDVCIVLDYNIFPRIRGRGSAIFFHLTGVDRKPTAGCIALDPEVMRRLVPRLSNKTRLRVLV